MNFKKIILTNIFFTLFVFSSMSADKLDVGADKVAKVNNRIITSTEVDSIYKQLVKMAPKEKKISKTDALNIIIQNELFDREIESAKNLILDKNQFNNILNQYKQVYSQEMLKKNPKFQYSDSKFKGYIETESKLTYEKFEKQIENEILRQQYLMKKADPKIQALNKKTYESASDFPLKFLLDDGKETTFYSLRDVYDKNLASYKVEKSIELKNISLSTVINANLDKLPEQEITRKRKLINDIYNRIKKGESFDDLCELYSEDVRSRDFINPKTKKYDRGYLGLLTIDDKYTKQELGEKVFNELFSLEKGQYKVIESKIGIHLFYVVNKRDKFTVSFEEAKPSIINMLKNTEQMMILQDTMLSTLDELKKKASIVIYKDEYKKQ